jgi:hypothetical protein
MGLGMSTPKVSVPKMGGKKKGAKAKPAKGTKAKKAKGTKAKKSRKSRKSKKSGYEDEDAYEDEDYEGSRPELSLAAFEGVAVKAGLRKPVSKFEDEDYEDEDYEEDEYESEGEEGYDWQKYAPADFTNMATPVNMSMVLLALLFIMIVLSRR